MDASISVLNSKRLLEEVPIKPIARVQKIQGQAPKDPN